MTFRDRDGRPIDPNEYDPYAQRRTSQEAAQASSELARVKEEPRVIGTVVEIRGDRMSLSIGFPPLVDIRSIKDAAVGDRVLLNRNTMAAIEVIKDKVPTGMVLTVDRIDGEMVQCYKESTLKAFRCAALKVRKGERVIIDACDANVIGSLGMPPPSFLFAPRVDVSWDDIGGQEEAKEALRDAIELPFAQPALFKAYGKKHCKGVLLHGAAGCGKTILAKAAASSNGKAHGKSGGAFIYVKGPELLNKWVGNSEQAVRSLFDAAREHKHQHGDPALIFIDEADALLGARDQGMHTGTAATGVVQQFLAEMDGLDETTSIMILATNRPDIIDPAVTRDGRIDRKVRVTRPTREDAATIFGIHLKARPLAGEGHVERAVEELFSDGRIVRDLGDRIFVRLRDMVSGAMIAGVVEQATTAAIRRDMAGRGKKASGLTVEDLVFAIDRAQRGVRDTNHGEVVKEMIEAAREVQLAEAIKASPSA